MILVRELLNRCDERNPRYTFKTENANPGVHSSRWFFFLVGYVIGGVVMRLYTRLLNEVFTFSGDSNLTLIMALLAIIGADAYVGHYLSPLIQIIFLQYIFDFALS